MKTEAEAGVMWPHAWGCLIPRSWTGQQTLHLEPMEGTWSGHTFTPDFRLQDRGESVQFSACVLCQLVSCSCKTLIRPLTPLHGPQPMPRAAPHHLGAHLTPGTVQGTGPRR